MVTVIKTVITFYLSIFRKRKLWYYVTGKDFERNPEWENKTKEVEM